MPSQPQETGSTLRRGLGFAACLALYFPLLKIFGEPLTADGYAGFQHQDIEPQPGLLPKTDGVCGVPDWHPVDILHFTSAFWAVLGIVANMVYKDGSRKVSLFHAISEVALSASWNFFCWDTSQGLSNLLLLQKSPALTWIVLWGHGYFLMDLVAEFYYEGGAFALHHFIVIYGAYKTTSLPCGLVQFILWAEIGGVVYNASRQFRNTKRNRLVFLIIYTVSRVPMVVMFLCVVDMGVFHPVPSVKPMTVLMTGGLTAVNLNFIRTNVVKYFKMKAD